MHLFLSDQRTHSDYFENQILFKPVIGAYATSQTTLMHMKRHQFITKTRIYNSDPLEPHFYIVKLGFTGVYIIFHISS